MHKTIASMIVFIIFFNSFLLAQDPEAFAPHEISLPSEADKVVWAGCGSILLLQMNKLAKVSVFDTRTEKIVGEIPFEGSNDVLVSGTAESIILVARDKQVMQRWSILSLQKTHSINIPSIIEILGIASGHASCGAIMVITKNGPQFYNSFNLTKIETEQSQDDRFWNSKTLNTFYISTSFDGLTYAVTFLNDEYSSFRKIWLEGNRIKESFENLSAENSFFFSGQGFFTFFQKDLGRYYVLPSLHPEFYIRISGIDIKDKKELIFSIHSIRGRVALNSNIKPKGLEKIDSKLISKALFDRIIFHPMEKKIFILNESRTQFYILPLDPIKTYEEKNLDYLFVSSTPITSVFAGHKYEYEIKAQSNRGKLKFTLESGPEWMNISEEGVLDWYAPSNFPLGNINILVKIEDNSNQCIFHSFIINIGEEPNSAVQKKEKTNIFIDRKSEIIAPHEINLPSKIDRVVWAGSGKFLLLQMNSIEKVAVFDVNSEKIINSIPFEGNKDVLVAGTAENIVLVMRDKNEIQSWSIEPFAKMQTATLPLNSKIDCLACGYAGSGPVLVMSTEMPLFFDLNNLKQIKIDSMFEVYRLGWSNILNVNAAPDNSIFIGSKESQNEFYTLKIIGSKVIGRKSLDRTGPAIPSADGSLLFTSKAGVYSANLKPLEYFPFNLNKEYITFPTLHPAFYIKIIREAKYNEKTKLDTAIYITGERDPVQNINELLNVRNLMAEKPISMLKGEKRELSLTERIIAHPKENKIFVIDEKQLVMHVLPINVLSALEKKNSDYFFVETYPITNAFLGNKYEYPIKAVSRSGKINYSLDSCPEGMKINSEGILTWQVPKNFNEASTSVIVKIEDGMKQIIFHSFCIDISEKIFTQNQQPEKIETAKAPLGSLGDVRKIIFPAAVDKVVWAKNGEVLLLQMNKLAKIAVFDIKAELIIGYVPFENSYNTLVIGLTDSIIVIDRDQKIIQKWSLDSLKQILNLALPISEEILSAAGGYASNGPILIVTRQGPLFYDAVKLNEVKTEALEGVVVSNWRGELRDISASADGSTFVNSGPLLGPSNISSLIIEGGKIIGKVKKAYTRRIRPNYDGSLFFTSNMGVLNRDFQEQSSMKNIYSFPAIDKAYYLGFFPSPISTGEPTISLYNTNVMSVFTSFKFAPGIGRIENTTSIESLPHCDRIIAHPSLKKLIIIDENRNQLHILPLDIIKDFEEKGIDYLFVESHPLTTIAPDTQYEYAIKVFSKAGKVRFSLINCPDGMTISPMGLLKWTVPSNFADEKTKVTIKIEDASNQNINHSFIIYNRGFSKNEIIEQK